MHILPLLLVFAPIAWGVFYLYRDIKKVQNWQLDAKSSGHLGDANLGDPLAGAAVDGSCHAAHAAGEIGSCDVPVGIDLGHFFHH